MQIKIYISFLITALFLCVPHTRAQEIEVPITLNEHGTQLRDVLRKIEQQSPYLFLYNETQLDMKQKINEKITSPDIRKILDRLCGPIGIRYEIMDVQILLMPKIDTGKPKPYPVPVTGYITDEKGSPMEFVSVIDLLSGKGGLTNEEGYFRFFTDKDSCRLQISHLAYKPELRTVGPDNRHLQIQLIPAVFNLDEVVAIGYGTLARKELTSAVGYVSSERFLSGKVNNPIQGIKGLIAGMSISGSSLSDINSIPDIQIRGAGSILAGNNPLVVVDGVPGVSLNSLSLAEIASISVLKDGSSAAIYGSNGANGVILITTKSGKSSDKLQANYQTYLAAAHEYNRPRVLSPEAFVAAGRDADLGYHTDWQAALIRSCPLEQNHDLSIQNGWKSGAFRISMNYRDGQGLDIVSSRREYALRTREAWHDGLYYTGDVAWRDEDGYLWFVGRADDVIKSSGYRIGPFEVESALMTHPAVVECAITGVPDEIRGQVVKATIVLAKDYKDKAGDALIKELQNHVKRVTAPYKYPRVVEFVDELPKTISGKIRRVEIRDKDNK